MMTQHNIDEFNLDDVMQKIREEVERRKRAAAPDKNRERGAINAVCDFPTPSTTPGTQETMLWQFLKRIQSIMRKMPMYVYIHRFSLKIKKYIPKYENSLQ